MPGPLPYLRLLRAGTLFSPAGDVVAGLCIAAPAAPWSPEAVRAIAASVLLYGAGMVWNDVADRREDARQRPERPIPSGAVPLGRAVAFAAVLTAAAMVATPVPWHHGLMAALVLAYDFACKRVALLGALTMGTLRALNLATGAAVAGHLPAALLVAATCYGGYILAVTVLGILEDHPSPPARAVAALQLAPVVLAFASLLTVQNGLWPAPAIAAVPLLVFARRNRQIRHWDQQAIRGSMTLLLLGTMGLGALSCLACGRPLEAIGVAAGIPLARATTRAIRLRTMS